MPHPTSNRISQVSPTWPTPVGPRVPQPVSVIGLVLVSELRLWPGSASASLPWWSYSYDWGIQYAHYSELYQCELAVLYQIIAGHSSLGL